MSYAELTNDLLLLYGKSLTSEPEHTSGGASRPFFDNIIGGEIDFETLSTTSSISNISDIVDIFSDDEETIGGYKILSDSHDTYEEEELSQKDMYLGGNIYSDDEEDIPQTLNKIISSLPHYPEKN